MAAMCVDCIADTNCASRTDHRDRCIGADHTCAQCSGTDVTSCDPNAVGGACLGTGLCGCSADTDCSASRRCDTSMHACMMRVTPDAGSDGGTDAGRTDGGPTDGSVDAAHRDGGMDVVTGGSVSGNGACACRTTGTGSSSRDGRIPLMLLGLGAFLARRRRIAR